MSCAAMPICTAASKAGAGAAARPLRGLPRQRTRRRGELSPSEHARRCPSTCPAPPRWSSGCLLLRRVFQEVAPRRLRPPQPDDVDALRGQTSACEFPPRSRSLARVCNACLLPSLGGWSSPSGPSTRLSTAMFASEHAKMPPLWLGWNAHDLPPWVHANRNIKPPS